MKRRDFLWLSSAFLAPSLRAREPAIDAAMEYERSSGGRIGFYARSLRTGTTFAWRAQERFVMCSSFKASLAACVLSHVDRGQDSLEQLITYSAKDIEGDWYAPVARANLAKGAMSVREMCKAAVEQSDNTCANILLARIGGPAAMTAFWRQIGDQKTRLDDSEPKLNRTPLGAEENTTTPEAMAENLRRFLLGNVLSEASRATFTGWMIGCQTGANRLRAGLPKDWVVGDKTGNNGKDAAGDIAVVWPRPDSPILVCAYTRGGSPTTEQIDAVFAGLGRFVGTHF